MSTNKTDFPALFRDHYRQIYRYVCYHVEDMSAAEDLTAEIFERAYRARDKYDPARATFLTWITRIAHNHVANYLISQGRRGQHESTIDLAENHTLSATDPTPEEQIIAHEAIQYLLDCLKRLSEQERQIISLRFGADNRNKEIAEQLAIKEHSISVLILRTLRRLHSCMESESQ